MIKKMKMPFLTAQQRAKKYATLYVTHYNLGDYMLAAKNQGLKKEEAEVVWEAIDQYEDVRPEEI